MNSEKLYCLKIVHHDLCRAIEKKWELQEHCNYGILLGMMMFCDDDSDEKLIDKIIKLYLHDTDSFLNFDFNNFN